MPGIIPPGPGGVDKAANSGQVIAEGDGNRWEGATHDEIWAMVQQGDPVAASEAASFAWMKTQLLIQSIEERLTAVVSGTAADWEGAAANAARGAVSTLGQWAIDGAAGARGIGQTLLDQSHEALHVRQHMPEPRTQALSAEWDKFWMDPGYVVENVFDGFADLRALEEQADNDARRARDLMTQYETRSRGDNIPRLQEMTPPPQVTVEIGPATAPAGGPGITAPGGPVPVGPAGVAPVAPAGTPGVPPPPVGEVPTPPAAVPPGAPAAVPPGGPGTTPTALPPSGPGATPTAVPPVPPGQAPPFPTPGTGNANTPPATPPAAQPAPFPTPGTAGPGNQAAPLPTAPGSPLPPGAVIPPGPSTTTTPLPPRPGGTGPGGTALPRPAPGWRDVVQGNAGGPGGRGVPDAPLRSAPFGERASSGVAEPAARPAAPRPGVHPAPGMYPPVAAGMGAGGQDREHRRAPFLIDDTGAFADDRWFPPAVITPDT
ncbi:hypothetical protein K1T35_39110 [Pseudonocardia sp. DSM 110487]|uniref:hypothetical protein n=1 Tax=Pseudonocardia sp. DSM 110487 TaxID=2865833 RepID=UPI001C69DECD|nr:hypothetical protein [Pseudonocardia sp. DSM 110487]QYN34360.1 hypothetical protein K1T35_39110 [Pseudonocardia sp. DSM 110487]